MELSLTDAIKIFLERGFVEDVNGKMFYEPLAWRASVSRISTALQNGELIVKEAEDV
jgi:hypothetical protein